MCWNTQFAHLSCGITQGLIKYIQAYSKRALQCQQHVVGSYLIATHQQAFDFMGVEENAYSLYFVGMTEDSCFDTACRNNQFSICRYICQKRKVSLVNQQFDMKKMDRQNNFPVCLVVAPHVKHVAFWTGDMDVAVEMYELSKRFPLGSNAKILR